MKITLWQIFIILAGLIMNINVGFSFEKQADGIVLQLQKQKASDAGKMKIQVCADDIIRVVAAPQKEFSSRTSLMVAQTKWEPCKWSVREEGNQINIATAKLLVKVDKLTGKIAFYDSKGRLLLQEKTNGSKIITPAEVMGEKTYHLQQLFDSPDDEAFYGLGQHQNNIMNYKVI